MLRLHHADCALQILWDTARSMGKTQHAASLPGRSTPRLLQAEIAGFSFRRCSLGKDPAVAACVLSSCSVNGFICW